METKGNHIKTQTALLTVPIATTPPTVYEIHTHWKKIQNTKMQRKHVQRANCSQWNEARLSSLARVTECNFGRGHPIVWRRIKYKNKIYMYRVEYNNVV